MKWEKSKLAIAVSVLLSANVVGASIAIAQEEQPEAEKQTELNRKKAEETEIIEVTGVRSGLEKALNIKRFNDSIVDAVSADDIGSLPALDLGEALQTIPGVTVNRENDDGSRRQSEITLRGLPSQFTQSTVEGQLFAAPSGSVVPQDGSPNPFGAFESSVFDGVVVYKTQSADLIEGSIAGVVDKQLADALSGPDVQFIVRLSGRYEELADSTEPGIFIAGTKQFIKDKFAGTFRYSHTEENFRRDILNITRYQDIGNRLVNEAEYRTQYGLTESDALIYPSDIRQYSNYSEGGRSSFTGGLEYKPTDNLKFGLDIMHTVRDFGPGSTLEIFNTVARAGDTRLTANSAPYLAYTLDDGSDVFAIGSYDAVDPIFIPGHRTFSQKQEATGGIFEVEYSRDQWILDASVSYSEASYERFNENIQSQIRVNGANPTGDFSFSSGMGNIANWSYDANVNPINLDQDFNLGNPPQNRNSVDGPGRVRFFYAGNDVFRDRDDIGLNVNFEYKLGHDIISSVAVGARQSTNSVFAYIYNLSMAGLNIDGISNDFYTAPRYLSGTNFFNGEAPGFFTAEEGWISFDTNNVVSTLFASGVDNPDNLLTSPGSGAIYQTTDGVNPIRVDATVDAEQTVTAAYIMANIDTEISDMVVWGNVGLRFVNTDIDSSGLSLINGGFVPETANTKYDHVLPSMNFSMMLREDLILRFAYSQSMVRPNLAGFSPSRSVIENENEDGFAGRVTINLPASDLEAYESDNYDMSLEWYNREGSAITLAMYRKDVSAFFDVVSSCPTDGGGLGYGPLELIGDITPICYISNSTADNEAGRREIRISETVNNDNTITIDGIEIGIQQKLDFLDGFWGGFGGVINASFLNVSGKDDDGTDLTFPRVSDEVYNIIGYWENKELSVRLAYNWRSDYFLAGQNSFTGFDDRQVKSRGQLDLAVNYKFNKNWSANFRAFNLTDELYEEFQSQNEMLPRLTAYDGRTYTASVTYRF
jgi:TonB-dependent receptor